MRYTHWVPALLVLTAGLVACDSDQPADVAVSNPVPHAAPVAQESADTKTPGSMPIAGPHGGKDPHASLTPEQYIQVVLQHLQEGRAPQALESVNKALYRYPGNAELLAMRGSLYLSRGDFSKALQDLEAAVVAAPDNPAYLVNRAQAYQQFSRQDEAMADLNKAVELNTEFLPARFNRGTLYFGKGEMDLAMADFEKCIEIDPHVAGPYFNRAAVYDAQGKRAEAIADIERFLEISTNKQWNDKAQELLNVWQQEGARSTDNANKAS